MRTTLVRLLCKLLLVFTIPSITYAATVKVMNYTGQALNVYYISADSVGPEEMRNQSTHREVDNMRMPTCVTALSIIKSSHSEVVAAAEGLINLTYNFSKPHYLVFFSDINTFSGDLIKAACYVEGDAQLSVSDGSACRCVDGACQVKTIRLEEGYVPQPAAPKKAENTGKDGKGGCNLM